MINFKPKIPAMLGALAVLTAGAAHAELLEYTFKAPDGYSAAIFLIPICISFDTAEKRRYATYLILNRRFSFEF